MKLDGMHHITMITGDARGNVAFYADVLGLRMVKKTVNFDAPDAYHLYFGDEQGSPGSILTWFEFAGAAPRPGRRRDDPHDPARRRLRGGTRLLGRAARRPWLPGRAGRGVAARSRTTTGSRLELVVAVDGNPPLRARPSRDPGRARDPRRRGRPRLHRARHRRRPRAADRDARLHRTGRRRVPARRRRPATSTGPTTRQPMSGVQGAGTVHHIAWHSRDEDHVSWQQRVARAGMHVTPVIDRDYFLSIYFRSRRVSCSRSRRPRPALRSTRTLSTSARSCGCRLSTSICARSSSAP